MNKLLFYYDWYYCLNNFSAHAVRYKRILYPTAEHAYQSLKFSDKKIANIIRKATSPLLAKELANTKYKNKFRPNWHMIKRGIMKKIVRAKISQHEEIKKGLMTSGNSLIVENSPTDNFWGWGKDCKGRNEMGKILMELRDELRK